MIEQTLLILAICGLLVFVARKAAIRSILGPRCKQDPRPGETWEYIDTRNGPWPNTYPPVTIVDVRDGWVRYDMAFLSDQRLSLDSFARMYRPHSGDKPAK